jgi:hypothetical protein
MIKPLESILREPEFREIDYHPYIQISKVLQSRFEEATGKASRAETALQDSLAQESSIALTTIAELSKVNSTSSNAR